MGSAHHIIGVGVICQGEAGTGAGHLIAVQRQHIHCLECLVINQAYLLLTVATSYSAATTRRDIYLILTEVRTKLYKFYHGQIYQNAAKLDIDENVCQNMDKNES